MVGIPKGVEFFETMVGNIVVDGVDRPVSFSAQLAAPWRNCLTRGRFELRGVLEAQGFADGVDISGELEIRPFYRDFLRYQFDFIANDGDSYRFFGEKQRQLLHPMKSLTQLLGTIIDSQGNVVGTCNMLFDVKSELRQFLGSWRFF